MLRPPAGFVLVLSLLVPVPALASVAQLSSPGGDASVDGGVALAVDAYGAFGSFASPASDATFNPPGPIGAAGTVYESGVHIKTGSISTFLAEGTIGPSGNLPSIGFGETGPSSVTSEFTVDGLEISLRQEVQDRLSGGSKVGSRLLQTYVIRNTTSSEKNFTMTRYLDGDLYFSEAFSNDWGGANGLVLFEYDSGDDPTSPTTYLGIEALGSDEVGSSAGFEINRFPVLREQILGGAPLGNFIHNDANGDGLTDSPYDVTLALARDYSLPAEAVTYFVTTTDFGQGEIADQPLDDIEAESISESRRSGQFGWTTGYDIVFENQELLVTIDIELYGEDPGQALRDQWERGIEGVWSDSYRVVDGIYEYPIRVELNWVTSGADHRVRVIQGLGRHNMLTWYTQSNWGATYQDEIAAHEAGHMFGLYDEYAGGAIDPATQLISNNSIMGDLGPVQVRHFEVILEWLAGNVDRDLSLAMSPLPQYDHDEPIADFEDPQPLVCDPLEVVIGSSWDGVSLQQILDAEYGVGTIDVSSDYEGAQCGDASVPYWLDDSVDGWIIREVADFAPDNILGWYAEGLDGPPIIDGIDDGVIFDGSGSVGETAFVGLAGPTRFGLYLNPSGADDGTNAPEPEVFFTNRAYNDEGPDGTGAIHAPEAGDPQVLIFNITHLRDGVLTYVLAWEDIDSGSPLSETYQSGFTDNDYNDLVVEIRANSPVSIDDDDKDEEKTQLAAGLSLRVAPNPFNPSTSVMFAVPPREHARVAVYDVRGREIDVLFEGTGTGLERSMRWTPRSVASGIYFVRLETENRVVTEKVTLLK